MKINRNNYEVFFLDHIDGKLSPLLVEELRAFLLLNPDLAAEFDDVQASMIPFSSHCTELFPDKKSLLKPELPLSTDALNELLAKEVEGQLSHQEFQLLEKLQIQFPFIASSRKQFSKTKLSAEQVSFENKRSIYFQEELNMQEDEMLLIALMEGDLMPSETNAIRMRLSADPKLAAQFALLQKTKLKYDSISFSGKNEVSFPEKIDLNDRRQLLIAKLEGDLTAEQLAALDIELAGDHELNAELLLLQKTKLTPASISFEFKDVLRKKETVVIPLRSKMLRFAAAAVAVIATVFWIYFDHAESGATLASNYNPATYSIDSNVNSKLNSSSANSHSAAMREMSSEQEVKSVANAIAIFTNEDSIIVRQALPELMTTIPAHDLAVAHEPTIMKDTPEMKLVMSPKDNLASQTSKESVTLLSYLGKTATEKLENTFAYTYAERQVERISSRTRNELEIDRQTGEAKDKIRFRIGSFSVQTDAKKKKDSTNRFAERLNRMYHSISGN